MPLPILGSIAAGHRTMQLLFLLKRRARQEKKNISRGINPSKVPQAALQAVNIGRQCESMVRTATFHTSPGWRDLFPSYKSHNGSAVRKKGSPSAPYASCAAAAATLRESTAACTSYFNIYGTVMGQHWDWEM
jgi:hypothetical protein